MSSQEGLWPPGLVDFSFIAVTLVWEQGKLLCCSRALSSVLVSEGVLVNGLKKKKKQSSVVDFLR